MSEKSLAMMHLWPYSCPEEAGPAPSLDHRSRSGWEQFKKPVQAEAVGCIFTGYGKPKRKFLVYSMAIQI